MNSQNRILSASRIALPLVSLILVCSGAARGIAQFDMNSMIEGKIKETLRGEPYQLNPGTQFPDVGNRAPQFPEDSSQVDVVKSPERLNAPLKPGDYAIPVMAYALNFGQHQPGQGQPYVLGKLEGKCAQAISVFLTRGTNRDAHPDQLNVIIWRLKVGLALDKLKPEDSALFHDLAPEFEPMFKKDFLDSISSTYKKVALFSGGKSLEDTLQSIGESGQYVASLYRARHVLNDKKRRDFDLPGLLFFPAPDDSAPFAFGPEPPSTPSSPWAEVDRGVFMRLKIYKGVCDENFIEVHVSHQASKSLTFGQLLGTAGLDGVVTPDPEASLALVGFSANGSATPLLLVPDGKLEQ
jgi:hypothetical protein